MPRPDTGLTLPELLLTLAITAVLLALAAPAYQHVQAQNQRFGTTQQLVSLLNYTRSLAVTRHERITFCITDDGSECDRNAGTTIVIFADRNGDGRVDPGELLHQERVRVADTFYRLRFSGRDYVRYRPDGTSIEFGSIVTCLADRDNRYAARLIVNRGGRVRHGRDLNGDGVVNDSDGGPVSCQL